MAIYGATTRKAGRRVETLIKARSSQAAAEAAAEHFELPASEGGLAVDSPSGSRTYYDVSASGAVTAVARRTAQGRWSEPRRHTV